MARSPVRERVRSYSHSSVEELPEGWERYESTRYPGEYFYYHVEKNISIWEYPPKCKLADWVVNGTTPPRSSTPPLP